MPYRVDIPAPPPGALDTLVELGALDIEPSGNGIAALLPDGLAEDAVARALGVTSVTVRAATSRDSGSTWLLSPGALRIGSLVFAPPDIEAPTGAIRLTDATAFGTGHHPTTALCVEALEEMLRAEQPDSILDVGTGSGILALAALALGVPRAVGLDIDAAALATAAENARQNGLADRLELVHGAPEILTGQWPLVCANVLAAPLIEMAPVLVRRLGQGGRLLLSGIPWSLESEVRESYQNLGIRHIRSTTRAGWTAWLAQASW